MSPSIHLSELAGPFAEPPAKSIVDEFREHIAKTGSPETFELLSYSKPPLELAWRVIAKFHVDIAARPNGNYIPCALCQTREKFLDGAMIWSADGHIRIVGNRCAKFHFGEAAARENYRDFEERQIANSAEEFLLEIGQVTELLLSEAENLKEKAHQLEAVRRDIKRVAPTLFKNLTTAARQSAGSLTITRRKSTNVVELELSDRMKRVSEFFEEGIAYVVGFSLFLSDKSWSKMLSEITQTLAQFPRTDDELLDALASSTNAEKVGIAHQFKRTAKRISEIFAELQTANTFICEENAVQIRRWLRETEQIERIHISLQGPSMLVSEYGHGQIAIQIAKNPVVRFPTAAMQIAQRKIK